PGIVAWLERQARPLPIQDLVEPLPELLERSGQVQPLLLFVTALLEPPPQGVQPAEATAHPAADEPPERGVRRVAHQDVVRELLEHVGRGDVVTERVLRTVPAGVTGTSHASSVWGGRADDTRAADSRHGSRSGRGSPRTRLGP